jgi:UDP-glucuronate 4-epimerase
VRVLLTGASGFIGAHIFRSLASDLSNVVVGLDSYSNYYSPHLKRMRFEALCEEHRARVINADISNQEKTNSVFEEFRPQVVVHLAAQAGVRLSPNHFDEYSRSNLFGFVNVMNAAVKCEVESVVYASSSSVYGDNASLPLTEEEGNLSPTSLYGSTKLSNEIIAATFSRRYGIRTRGLRFFTVYGPWGRPDMAYFRILSALQNRDTFYLSGDGSVKRDFTYIDDVVTLTRDLTSELKLRTSGFHDVVNLGHGSPHSMMELIETLENLSGEKLKVSKLSVEPSDVKTTHASSTYRESLIGKVPATSLVDGLIRFVQWGRDETIRPLLQEWVKSSEAWTN